MSRTNEKWFGFNLTQKQAVWIFTIALIAVLLISYMIFSLFYMYIINFILNPYYTINILLQLLITMLPSFVILVIFLAISVYTLIKTRKIAKYYSQEFNQPSPKMKEE